MNNKEGGGLYRVPPFRSTEQACHLATALSEYLDHIKFLGRRTRVSGDGRTATFEVKLHHLGQYALSYMEGLGGFDIKQIGAGTFLIQRSEVPQGGLAV